MEQQHQGRIFAPTHIAREAAALARDVNNTRSGKVISDVFSLKNGQLIRCESTLERDAAICLEFDPRVVSYRSQPKTIFYRAEGKAKRWTPDFQVTYAGQVISEWVEVKPLTKTFSIEFRTKQNEWIEVSRARGHEFRLSTEADIRMEPRLSNIRALYRYARLPLTADDRSQITRALAPHGRLTVSEIAARLGAGGKLPLVYAALWAKVLECPSHLSIGKDTPVYLPGASS